MISPLPFQTTPILRDAQQTARDFGVVSNLLEINKILRQDRDIPTAIMLLDRVLSILGVTNDELIEHLKAKP